MSFALAKDANNVGAFPWVMADFVALIAWGSWTFPWIMTFLVALVAYALGAIYRKVTFLGARGAYERQMVLVTLLVVPWLLVVCHYGGGIRSGRLHMMRVLFICTCHHL